MVDIDRYLADFDVIVVFYCYYATMKKMFF